MSRHGIVYATYRAVTAAALIFAPCAAGALPRTVLILDQSTPGLYAYTRLVGAMRIALNADRKQATTIYSEHLDLTLFGGSAYEQMLGHFLHEKYTDRPIGIIVAVGAAALDFALKLQTAQWGAVPIVFCAVDARAIAPEALPKNVTGQTVPVSLSATVSLARTLVPNLRSIALIGDPLDRQTYRREFMAELPAVASRVALINELGFPLAEVTRRVAELPDDSAIVYTSLTADGSEAIHTPIRALELVAEHANRPIFVDIETYIGHGATGGLVLLPSVVGTHAAELVLRLFSGEAAAQIPVTTLTDAIKPVFDWRQLQRWQISETQLPPGSDIRFRKLSIWQEHSWLVIAAVSAFLLQTALIFGLLYEDRRRRLAEAEARQRLSESAYLSRIITAGALSASIAHEIRQPLAAIVSYGDAGLRWLANKNPDYAEVKNSLTRIVDQGHRASAIIENVRALFKKDIDHRTVFDMNSVIRDVFQLTANELKTHNIAVKTALSTMPRPIVLGDRVQLEQVVMNLFMNAIEAMRLVNSRNRVLTVRSQVEHEKAVLMTFEDTGPGIDPNHIDRIFTPYFTTKMAGMGMGLSICKSIVGSHGGRITATSTKGHGTVFHLTLPLHSTVAP